MARGRASIHITAPVCEKCNNRWLSVLENDVRPALARLVRGEKTRTLSVGVQRLLATWAVKTALMLDLSTGSPVVPTGFLHDFRLRRCPLESHFVWLGAYRAGDRTGPSGPAIGECSSGPAPASHRSGS